MQTVNAALQIELNKGQTDPIVLIDLFEFYASTYVPHPTNGFEPASAIQKFAAETITWNGIAYMREAISRGDIVRNMGEKTNSVSLTFSNISRYMATLAQSQTIEGLFLVIRCVSPSVTTDSIVLFVGRCDKPSDIDKKTFSLNARQDFGNINQEIPPRLFTADDPEGRTPSDPLYEGIRITALSGTFTVPVTTASTSFFGRLLGKKKTVNETRQWSSLDATPYGSVIPILFGRVQMELIPIMFSDIGQHLLGVWVVGEGRVDSITATTIRDSRFLMQTERQSFGDPGGTGTNNIAIETSADPAGRLNHGYLSKTAYIVLSIFGSERQTVDESPPITSLVRGVRVPVPDASGVFGSSAWSDNPVAILRFILTDPRMVRIDPGFMEDSVNYQTFLHCEEPLIDDSNGEVSLLPLADLAQGGTGIRRFRSTGVLSARWFLYHKLGDTSIIPEQMDNDYTGFDPDDVPDTFTPTRLLRKRYTANFPVTERVRAVDLAYKVVNPAGKLFIRVNKRGKYEIRTEKSSDATMLRSATAVGATALPILDATPWKTGPDLLIGRLLMGFGLITSEVRNVSTADFSVSGNSVTLVTGVTGTITATRSGATLTGGSTTVQASGTVTIGGTPALGNTVTVTIDGVAVVYTLTTEDTTSTVAAMIAAHINATPKLARYISATWLVASPTIVTIKCKHGALNLDSALLKAHSGPIADPTASPVLGSSAGALEAGTYKVAYAEVNSLGKSALSPIVSIVLAASKKIDVSALALVGTSRNWYMSDAPGSSNLKFVSNTNGSAFSINALPSSTAAIPQGYNTTGEELLRIAMSFATNSQDVYPVWPASTLLILNDIYLPTTPNGHKYQVTTAGTTSGTEPTWPLTAGGTVVNGGVTFTEIGSTVLQQAGLTRANIVKDSYKWPLGSRQSSVNQIKGNYRDANNDFALTPFKVNDPIHQAQVNKIYPLEVDLSAVDNFHQMFRLANWQLAKNREGDWFNSLETGPAGLVLEEGDPICASDDSGGLVNVVTRIEELRIKPNHDVSINQARKYSTRMFADEVGADTIPVPTTLRYTQTVDSIIEFIDSYPIRDEDGLVVGFYVAVSRDLTLAGDWRGFTLWADYGDGYLQIAQGDIPAIMGVMDTTLATVTDASVFDRANSFDFTLQYGPLAPFAAPFSTVTESELLSNPRRNLFRVGNEYVQAGTIVDNGDLSYTASILLRGRFGTNTTELIHSASETIVYLDGSEVLVSIDPVRLNHAYNYKAVTTNQDVADATPVSFTWTGGTAKPLPPSSLRGERDSDDNLLILWNRRTRIGGWMIPGSEVPLAEEQEKYIVEIPDATPPRSWPVITGMGMAALLESSGANKFTDITVNTLQISSVNTVRARSLQEITETGNYVEATLNISGNGAAGIGFIATGAVWKTVGASTAASYYAELRSPSGTTSTLKFYVNGVEVHSEDGGGWISSFRVRIILSGSEVRFVKSWVGPATPAQYVSAVQPSFPMKVLAQVDTAVGGTYKVEKVVMTINPQPATIYTANQMTEDGLTPGDPVDVRVAQVSAIVGVGGWAEATL